MDSPGDSLTKPQMHLITATKRSVVSTQVQLTHPCIRTSSLPYIFPLYNPSSVDFVIFWSLPSRSSHTPPPPTQATRSGYLYIPGPLLGASHAPLADVIAAVETGKAKRSMFAETQREREDIMSGIRECEWNLEVDPLVVSVSVAGADERSGGEVMRHDFSEGWVLLSFLTLP